MTVGVWLATASLASADRVWIGRLAAQDVQVREVVGDELIYIAGSRERRTSLDEIVRIELDDEPRFNAAEEAYQGGDWNKAAAQYSDVLGRRGADAWVQRRATFRLVDAAARANLFREAVDGYVALVALDAEAAATRQPDPARTGVTPEQVQDAHQRVRTGLSSASEDTTRKTLLSFLLRLDTAAGDAEAASNTVKLLTPLVGETVPADQRDWPTYARIMLSRAELALSTGKPAEAETLINDAGRVFIEPALVADALLKLAKAKEQQAGDDKSKLLDAAYAYLRVPAQASDVEPASASALLAAGDIHAKLGLSDDADKIYRHLTATYPGTDAAAEVGKRQPAN